MQRLPGIEGRKSNSPWGLAVVAAPLLIRTLFPPLLFLLSPFSALSFSMLWDAPLCPSLSVHFFPTPLESSFQFRRTSALLPHVSTPVRIGFQPSSEVPKEVLRPILAARLVAKDMIDAKKLTSFKDLVKLFAKCGSTLMAISRCFRIELDWVINGHCERELIVSFERQAIACFPKGQAPCFA